MNATIPQILNNMITNAKEIVQSRDATEDIADCAAAIIGEATELLERWEGKPVPDAPSGLATPQAVLSFSRAMDDRQCENEKRIQDEGY